MNLHINPAFSDNEEHYQSTIIINEPSNAPKPTSTEVLSTEQSSTSQSPLFTQSSPKPQQQPPAATQISFRTVLLSDGFNKRSRNFAEEPSPEEVTESNSHTNMSIELIREPTKSPPTTRQSRRLMIDLSDMSVEQVTYLVLGMVIMYIVMNAAAICLSWFIMSVDKDEDDGDGKLKKGESFRESNSFNENYRINPVFVDDNDVEAPLEPEWGQQRAHESISTIPEEDDEVETRSSSDCRDSVGVIEVHASSDEQPLRPRLKTQSEWPSASGVTVITVVPVVAATSTGTSRKSETAGSSNSIYPVSTDSCTDNEERFREMEIIEGRELSGGVASSRRRSSTAVTTGPMLLLGSAKPAENLPDVVDNVSGQS